MATNTIPSYFTETNSIGSEGDDDVINRRRLSLAQSSNPLLHCETHILSCQLILVIAYIMYHPAGSPSQVRVEAVIISCQRPVALGSTPGLGQLTFVDDNPEGGCPSHVSDG